MNSNTLSIQEARKLALLCQRVLWAEKTGRAIDATLNAIEHLGYVQIDTISVVQRAHHHTLWNRNPRYKTLHVDKLLEAGKIFEYWSHAAAYLPIEDYRFSLPNKEEIRRGRKLWYDTDPNVKRHVLQRIRNEGPLQSKDFERTDKGKLGMWEWKPAKYALEQLFMEGKLMVVRRQGFQKVYDLASRVLPAEVDASMPTRNEYCSFLIKKYLASNGFGDAAEIAYLRQGMKQKIQTEIDGMAESGDIAPIIVKGHKYFTIPGVLEKLSNPLPRSRLKILSPFDNFVIQRKRINQLFDYDYQIECYVPEAKRKYGYFCLPIVWNAKFVGRLDCKADRKSKNLIIKSLALEPRLTKLDRFAVALIKELSAFLKFNDCDYLNANSVSNKFVQSELSKNFPEREGS